ncbi:MAG: hypothetical protein Q7K54_05155 [Candidatus Parcubacteria bacterium]|nr:hypothetical protein [Candidatus Parcubacteria bacterium]
MNLDKKLDKPVFVIGTSATNCPDVTDGRINTLEYDNNTTRRICNQGTNNIFYPCRRKCSQNIVRYCKG